MPRQLQRIALILTLVFVGNTMAKGEEPLRVFNGSPGQIRSIAFAPNGKTIAASGMYNSIHIWDTANGKELHQLSLPGQGNWALAVAYSPDGKRLVSSGWDGSVRMWDPLAGKELFAMAGHRKPEVHHVAFSPNGKLVASAGYDETVRLWNPATEKQVLEMKRAPGRVYVVAFSPDSKIVASGGHDCNLHLWDTTTGKELQCTSGHGDMITALVFSPDGKTIYSGSHDGNIREWDVETGKPKRKWATNRGWARTLSLSPDGRSLAVANQASAVQVWELATLKERRVYPSNGGVMWAVAFSPDGKKLATGGDDQQVRLWDQTGGWDNPEKPRELTPDALEGLWNDLGSNDAGRAYTATWALATDSKESVPFLAKRLKNEKPPRLDTKRVTDLITQLDDEDFDVREKASAELAKIGGMVREQLTKALTEGSPSVEQKRRLEALLEKTGPVGSVSEEVRTLRIVEALSKMDSQEAKKLRDGITKASAPMKP